MGEGRYPSGPCRWWRSSSKKKMVEPWRSRGFNKATEITNANFFRSHVGKHKEQSKSPPHSETPAKKKKRPAHEQKETFSNKMHAKKKHTVRSM